MILNRISGFAFALLAVALATNQAEATLYLSDDFSTFASGDLVGQSSWTQLLAVATLPVQVTSGQVVIPGSQTVDNQDVWKDISVGAILPPGAGTTSVFYGLDVIVDSAPVVPGTFASPSYFAAMYNAASPGGAGNFANQRLTAIDNTANVAGTYVLGARITGQAGDPFTYGTTALTYGTLYHVVVQMNMVSGAGNDTLEVFVDGVSHVTNSIGTGTDPAGIAAFVFSQFASGTVGNVGARIGAVRVADNYAEAVPEPSALVLGGFSLIGLLGWIKLRQGKKGPATRC